MVPLPLLLSEAYIVLDLRRLVLTGKLFVLDANEHNICEFPRFPNFPRSQSLGLDLLELDFTAPGVPHSMSIRQFGGGATPAYKVLFN